MRVTDEEDGSLLYPECIEYNTGGYECVLRLQRRLLVAGMVHSKDLEGVYTLTCPGNVRRTFPRAVRAAARQPLYGALSVVHRRYGDIHTYQKPCGMGYVQEGCRALLSRL